MASWGLDLLSKLAESSSLDDVREDFPRQSDEGLNPSQFLAVVRKHIGEQKFNLSPSCGSGGGGQSLDVDDMASKVGEIFKQMDVRGDGDVSWEDFSAYVLQLELLHDGKGAAENEDFFKPIAAHLGLDGHIRGGGVVSANYLSAPVEKLSLIVQGNEVVHLIGQGPIPDDDEAPFRVESGAGSDLARISWSLRHDTAYKPHQVLAVHSIPGQDVVITSSSLGLFGPHFLTVWDLPTEEERSREKQFLPALTSREETPTAQTVIYWAPTLEMVLTASSGNGSLLGWEISPLRQCAKLWVHDAGITHVHELMGHAGGTPHLVTVSLDGTIAVCGGTKGSKPASASGVLQRLQAHEKGVAHMSFCLQHSVALSAGVFVNTVETTPDVLVWRLDRFHGLLAQDIHTRLRGHIGQVIGIAFVEEESEVVTGGSDATFLVWHLPSLLLKQRFTRLHVSPMADQVISCMAVVPPAQGRPLLLATGMMESGGFELYASVEQKVHEALIKAEFCTYLQRFVTISARRATVWDGKTGEALTTLTSERLLGNAQADITAFSLDHQGHKFIVGADTGDIRACASHNGSVIRDLDPHDGTVNWLSFASRKTDKCVFSIGGDGALHVLDDADAKGYVRPSRRSKNQSPLQSSVRQKARTPYRNPSTATGRAADTPSAVGSVGNNANASPKLGDRGASRAILQSEQENKPGRRAEGRVTLTRSKAAASRSITEVAAEGDGHAVLLRRIAFSSENSAGTEDESSVSSDGGYHRARRSNARPLETTTSTSPALRYKRSGTGLGVTLEEAPSTSDGSTASFPASSTESLHSAESSVLSPKARFVRAARVLMSQSGRDDLLEKNVIGAGTQNEEVDALFAKPRHDMVACAADDHLNLIATAATSDGGIENIAASGGAPKSGSNTASGATKSSRAGRPSTCVHLWDAEMMTLAGTLLLPCLHLTRDLANAANAFGLPSIRRATVAANAPPVPVVETSGQPAASAGKNAVLPQTGGSTAGTVVIPDAPHAPGSRGRLAAAERSARVVLVTALEFCSPYPLLIGACTGGAALVWRVPECVCIQAILLPADLSELRGSGRGAGGAALAEEDNLMCLARGTVTSQSGEETTVVYAGNERGDIVATQLSPGELAALSGEAQGQVPCQRRANHNPYRAVRVTLTPHKAEISLKAACRAQRKAVSESAGTRGLKRDDSRRMLPAARGEEGNERFAVRSTLFQTAWVAHSAAVSSISWIRSPPAVLSASADGLARIWTPDGGTQLGQLDINIQRPERAMPSGARQWTFLASASHRATRGLASDLRTTAHPDKATKTAEIDECGDAHGTKDDGSDGTKENHTENRVDETVSSNETERNPQEKRPGSGDDGDEVGDDFAPDGSFPTVKPGTTTRAHVGEIDAACLTSEDDQSAPPQGLSGRKKRAGGKIEHKPEPDESMALLDGRHEPWLAGWHCMTRHLKEFEESLQASSLDRRGRADRDRMAASVVGGSSTSKSVRKTPLNGKRWRIRSDHWPLSGGARFQQSESVQDLGHTIKAEDGGDAVAMKARGSRGYVRPRPGTAEDEMLKRAGRKDATGIVTRDKGVRKSRPDVLKGRPLQEWLASPRKEETIACAGRNKCGHAASSGVGEDSPTYKAPNGLPPVAILAGSRGGRLVASDITVAGDKGGGGFNVKIARAAAREEARLAAAKETCRDKGRGCRSQRNSQGARTKGRGGGDVGGRFWRLGKAASRASGASSNTIRRKKDNEEGNGGSVDIAGGSAAGAPLAGGVFRSNPETSLVSSSGSGGGSGGTDGSTAVRGSERDGAVTDPKPPKFRGLNADSVLWTSSSRRVLRSTPSARGRRGDGAGQGETIRRLVHMGFL